MTKHLRQWVPIILLNIIVAVAFLIITKKVYQTLFFEFVFFLSFYLKNIHRQVPSVISEDEDIVINGVFRVLRTSKSEFVSLQYKKDMLAKVMDWDLLIVNMSSKNVAIYVRHS